MTANIDNRTRRSIYARDGFRCALCDSTDGLQIHHVIPRGRGGGNSTMNLITLCWRCHAAAHGTIINPGQPSAQDIEQACVEYVSDYYANQGRPWSPWGPQAGPG